MDIMTLILKNLEFVFAFLAFAAGWYFDTKAERRHLASLDKEEAALGQIYVSSERFFVDEHSYEPMLVVGSVVIAQDRFKLVVASFLSLFGKNLTTYESLLERARREALVRAKRQADDHRCQAIYGLRFEMTEIEGGVEMLAYGTAVKCRV